jgi:hypothetical protein
VIYRRTPRDLFGSIDFDGGPFAIAEFVAHDSRLRFRSLNDVSGRAINRQRPVGVPLMVLNLLPAFGVTGVSAGSPQSRMTQIRHSTSRFTQVQASSAQARLARSDHRDCRVTPIFRNDCSVAGMCCLRHDRNACQRHPRLPLKM